MDIQTIKANIGEVQASKAIKKAFQYTPALHELQAWNLAGRMMKAQKKVAEAEKELQEVIAECKATFPKEPGFIIRPIRKHGKI